MVTQLGAGAGKGAEIEEIFLSCQEQTGLQRVKPGREGCPQSRVPGFLCLQCLPARVLGIKGKTPGWAELRTVLYPRPGVQFKRIWNPGDRQISDCLLGKPQVEKPSSTLVPYTPSRCRQPRV